MNAEAAGTERYRHRLRWHDASVHIHDWDDDAVGQMSAYERSGPRLTADNPLVVQFKPVG